jgi:large subunit ribosomal protein L25
MQSITIKGSKRESVGKKNSKALRNAEKIPCVLYGGEEPVHFSADELSFKPLVYTPNVHMVIIEIDGGGSYKAIMQDVQFHPVTDKILHIDFYQLHDDKAVTLNIPVKLHGNAIGVRNGGVLKFTNRKLSVTALPADLPDFIGVSIEKLKIGDKVVVGDLDSENFKFNHPENIVVCQVKTARAAILDEGDEDEEEDGAEGAESTDGGEGEKPAEQETSSE